MKISPATAPLNNAFFIDNGLIERSSKAGYKPTDIALAYQRKWTFDRDAAPQLLAPAFADSWFFEAVTDQLQISGTSTTTRAEMIGVLASRAGTDSSYSVQYGHCLDWLKYSGLIIESEGTISFGEEADVSRNRTSAVSEAADERSSAKLPDPGDLREAGSEHAVTKSGDNATVMAISLDLRLTADDLARLGADEIKALFVGAAEIAAIQSRLA